MLSYAGYFFGLFSAFQQPQEMACFSYIMPLLSCILPKSFVKLSRYLCITLKEEVKGNMHYVSVTKINLISVSFLDFMDFKRLFTKLVFLNLLRFIFNRMGTFYA